MAFSLGLVMKSITDYIVTVRFWPYIPTLIATYMVARLVYNVFLHPLARYPGPLLWRATRLPASYHHATGDLYKKIAAIHAKHGPTVRIAPDELSFTTPEAWPQIYNSRPQLEKTQYHFAPKTKDSILPQSMITAGDAEHARLRRLTGPAFLNAGIAEVEPVLQHYSNLLISQLTAAANEGSQNIVEWFLWTLNDVIGQLALDQEFQCLEKRRMHPWPSFLLGALKSTAALNQFRRYGFPLRVLGPFLPQKLRDARINFVSTAISAIKQRLQREKENEMQADSGHAEKRPDIVGLMLRELKSGERLSEAEITANSILIVGGGSETTSTLLSALLYYLCKTPRVMKKLQNEVRQAFTSSEYINIKGTQSLPYLKATVDETLRIFPVASYITPRVTPKGGHTIAGDHVPENTSISMGQWFMGRSDRFFDSPLEFRPERWLDSDSRDPSGRPVEDVLKPFSMGPRNCLGKLMALTEARLLTAKLLWTFEIELDGSHETWVEDARFYIAWQLQPLMVKLMPRTK